jgi:hypothetical protein
MHKYKVGDKIEIVADHGGHQPPIIVGDTHIITEIRRDSEIVTDHGNIFQKEIYDEIQLYKPEIPEENKDFSETKPSYDEILNGSFMLTHTSASVAPKRSRSKPKVPTGSVVL